MNMNKKVIKGTAITAATVTVIAATGIHMVHAADTNKYGINKSNIIQVAENTTNTATTVKDVDATAYKDETVYVIADASGNAKKVIVSDWLKNVNSSAGLNDWTTLSNLVNVKGTETFELQGDNSMIWNAEGNDIYYQGTTDAKLPVTVKVTYTLDGVEMKPEEMVGKSGKLVVRYDYTNLLKESVDINGTKEDIFTPIMMVTGTILSNDNYSNVEVKNGKVISDGNNQVVVGIGLPGLKDSLKVDSDKLNVPEFFEYSADVTDFSLGTSVSVGLTDMLADIGIDENLDLEDIQTKVDDLVDGVDQLVEGSTKLYDGTGDLYDGTEKLYDGSSKLYDGTNQLYDGSSKLGDGANQLYDGLTALLTKTGDFKDAVKKMSTGLTTLKDALGSLETGAKALDDGAAGLVTGATSLNTGLKSAKDGMDQIVSNYASVETGAGQISTGITQTAQGLGTLTQGIENTNKTYATLSETVTNDEAIIAALKQVNGAYNDPTIAELIKKLEANTAGQKQIADGLTAAGGQLLQGAKDLSTGASQLQTGVGTLTSGISALDQGSQSVKAGLDELYKGSGSLLDGAKQLNAGTTSLVTNSKELAGAGKELEAGGTQLYTASKQLNEGVGTLQTGANTLKTGVSDLKTGVGNLRDGANTLNNGVGDLKTGASSLRDGAGELKNGIQTLQEDGISKIEDIVNGDLNNIVERLKAVVNQSKAYKNYSGIGDDMDGNVKFVIKYESNSEQ